MRRFQVIALLSLWLTAAAAAVEEKRFQVPLENSPALGPADAPLTVVEFLDFQ